MRQHYTFISIAMFATAQVWAQSVESLGFDPAEIRPGSISNYTLVLKNINGNIDASSIPLPKGLEVVGQSRSQSFSMGTGGTSSELRISYAVRALAEGAYNVPAWKVKYGSEVLDIAAASLKVSPDAPEQPAQQTGMNSMAFGFGGMPMMQMTQRPQPSLAASQTARKNAQSFSDVLRSSVKLDIKLPREKIYVGESIPCELVFSCKKSIVESGFKLAQLAPKITNADAFDCPAFTSEPLIDVKSDVDMVLIKYHTVITPLKVGEYNLDFAASGMFNREISMDDLMNMSAFDPMMSAGGARQIPFEVNMPAKKINVRALPEDGRPADFTGAIGKFSLEGTTAEPDVLNVGEPCTMILKIVGVGNFSRISPPIVDGGGDWKTYKFKTSFADESNGLGNIGVKTFECTVVPNKPDLKFAPKILFNYFDPESGKYVSLFSKDISVSVAPSGRSKRAEEKKENAVAQPAFTEIAEKPAVSRQSRIIESPYFWGGQLLILAGFAAFVVRRKRTLRLQKDPAYAKLVRCKKETEARLRDADAAASAKDCKKFFENARAALQAALSAETELEGAAILLREAETLMHERGVSEADVKDAAMFFEGQDALTFGGLDTSSLNLRDLSVKLRKIINEAKPK